MSEHIIKVKGNDIHNFLVFKIREDIPYGLPSEAYPLPMLWDIMTNIYTCNIDCTDEQLVMIKLKYAH